MFEIRGNEALMFGDVGQYMPDGIGAADVVSQLRAFGDRDFTLRLNSNGGEVFEGLAIYSALSRHRGRVTVSVEGIAASIASVIAMAGDRVEMQPEAMLMIHNPFAGVIGEADDLRQTADVLDKIAQQIAGIYAKKSGGSVTQMMALMNDASYFDAEEAVTVGLADSIASEDRPRIAAHSTRAVAACVAYPNREQLRLRLMLNAAKHRAR